MIGVIPMSGHSFQLMKNNIQSMMLTLILFVGLDWNNEVKYV